MLRLLHAANTYPVSTKNITSHASVGGSKQRVFFFSLGVPEDLWEQLKEAGKSQTSHLYSNRPWSIDGGNLLCSKGIDARREILLTGHEDGTVRFWDAGNVTLTPIYKFSTSQYFIGDDIVGKTT